MPLTPDSPRPRQRRKQDRPAEIIAAGLAEFSEKGFAQARIEDIARRAGIAKGTVFRYFPNKEALFEAAILSRIAPVFDEFLGLLDLYQGPSLALLEGLVERIYARFAESDLPVLMRIIITEGPRFPAILEIYHRQSVARGQALLGRIIARGVARGEFPESALTELPMVLMAPALMSVVWRMTFDAQQPLPLQRFKAAHLALLRAAFPPAG